MVFLACTIMDVRTTAEEAKAQALDWLKAYRAMSHFEWEQLTATTISHDLLPGLPCYVMAVAAAGSGGFRPSLAFTVGTKGGDQGYWQGFFPDKQSEPGLTAENLSQLDSLLNLLVTAARIPA